MTEYILKTLINIFGV